MLSHDRPRRIIQQASGSSGTARAACVMRINDDAKTECIAVEVREASGNQIAVSGALQSGDRVAVRGAEALDDGELVAVQTET